MSFQDIWNSLVIDSLIPELACLSADVFVLGTFYYLYRKKSKCVEALQNAPEFELDTKLQQKIRKAEDKVIPFAILRGAVRGTIEPIPSQYVPGAAGLIRQSRIVEHRVRWNPISRWWSDSQHEIQCYVSKIPFQLCNSSTLNRVRIHVEEPLTAEGLELSTVYNKFIPKSDTLGGYLFGWVRGEHSRGFQVTECLLTEGTLLTGIGELVLKGKEIHLRPSQNLGYFLTPLTKDELVRKLEKDVSFYKVFTVTFGILGLYIMFLVGRSWFAEYKRRIQANMIKKKHQEERKQRLRTGRTSGLTEQNATPVCVVCLANPVEVMVMECGHVCLCIDCADQVSSCPICRRSIADTVAAFLP